MAHKEGGYLLLWRSLASDSTWANSPYCILKLWIWILMEATHRGNVSNRNLKPGQLDHSIRFIYNAMEWYSEEKHRTMRPSFRTIERHLKILEKDGKITRKTTPGVVTVITVCNWKAYQEEISKCGNSDGNSDGNKLNQCSNNGNEDTSPPPPQEETSSLKKLASIFTELDPEKKKPPYSLFNRWINSYTPKFPSKSDAEKFIVQAVEHIHHSKTAADFEKTSHLTGFLVKVLENAYDKVEAERPRERRYQTDLIPDGPLGYKRRSDA